MRARRNDYRREQMPAQTDQDSFGSCGPPQPLVIEHHPGSVHAQLGDERSVVARVLVAVVAEAPILLLERLQEKTGKAEPCRARVSGVAHAQVEASDRQLVGRWREGQVDVDAAV